MRHNSQFTFYLLLILILCSYTSAPIFAQDKPSEEWSHTYGGKRTDEANAIIETYDGHYAIVGQSKSEDSRNKKQEGGDDDLLFMLIDKDGKVKVMKSLGFEGKEGGYSIIQTFDGGFAIAGFSDSKKRAKSKKRDAWLVKLNQKGDLLWEKRFGGEDDDEFRDILQLKNGDLVAIGKQAESIFFLRIDWQGNSMTPSTKTIPFSGKSNEAYAITQTSYGNLLIGGRSGAHPLLFKTDIDGNIIGDAQIYDSKNGFIKDVVELQDNQFLALANTFSNSKQNDFNVLITDRKGEIKLDFPIGDRRIDRPFASVENYHNNILLTGGRPELKGRYPSFYLAAYEKEGEFKWEDWYKEKNTNDKPKRINRGDIATDLIQDNEGNLVLVGFTEQGMSFGGASDVWIVKLKSSLPNISGDATIDTELADPYFIDETGDGLLESGERSYVQFSLLNEGAVAGQNIIAQVKRTSGNDPIDYFQEIHLGYLYPNQQKYYSIPIEGLYELEGDLHQFSVSFIEQNGATIPPLSFLIETKREPRPDLVITDYEFTTERGKDITRRIPTTLTLQIQNKGDLAINNFVGTFSLEKNITALSDKKISIESIDPGETKTFDFTFKIDPVFEGAQSNVGFRFSTDEDKYLAGVSSEYTFSINGEKEDPPLLVLVDYDFESVDGTAVERGKEIKMDAIIENLGDMEATNVSIQIDHSTTAMGVSEKKLDFKIIEGNSNQKANYVFKVAENYQDNIIRFRCIVSADDIPTIEKELILELPTLRPPSLVIENVQFQNEPARRGVNNELSFTIVNTGGMSAKNIKGFITSDEAIESDAKQAINISTLEKGEAIKCRFPFSVNRSFTDSRSIFIIELGAENINNPRGRENGRTVVLNLENYEAPSLEITSSKFLMESEKAKRSENITWEIEIKNSGGNPFNNLKVDFEDIAGLQVIENQSVKIKKLDIDETKTISFTFKILEENKANRIFSRLIFSSSDLENGKRNYQDKLDVEALQPPKLYITDESGFDENSLDNFGNVERGKTIRLYAFVKNEGQLSAQNVRGTFQASKGSESSSNSSTTIDILKPGEIHQFEYQFIIPSNFNEKEHKVTFTTSFDGVEENRKETYYTPIAALRAALLDVDEELRLIGNTAKRNTDEELRINFTNVGEQATGNLEITFDVEDGIEVSVDGDESQPFRSVIPGKSDFAKFRFKITDRFLENGTRVNYKIEDIDNNKILKEDYVLVPVESVIPPAISIQHDFNEKKLTKRGIQENVLITISNTGGSPAKNLKLDISLLNGKSINGFENKTLEIPQIDAGESKDVEYNFEIEEDFKGKEIEINIKIAPKEKDASQSMIDEKDIRIRVEPIMELLPNLIVVNNGFNPTMPTVGEEIIFSFSLENKGNGTANNLSMTFTYEDGIEAISEKKHRLKKLDANTTKDFEYSFKIERIIKEDVNRGMRVGVRVQSSDKPYLTPITEYFYIQFKDKKPETPFIRDITNLSSTEESNQKNIQVEYLVESKEELNQNNFKVKIGDRIMKLSDSKAGEEPIRFLKKSSSNSIYKKYKVTTTVELKEGNNSIQLIGQYEKEKEVRSEELEVIYKLKPTNIHLLAIGIDNYSTASGMRELKYAKKDAQNIIDFFKRQEEKDYVGKVHVNKILNREGKTTQTTVGNIIGEIGLFCQKSEPNAGYEYVDENDIIVVYISGHGKMDNSEENYYIIPSDYQSRNDKGTTTSLNRIALNFENDILDPLKIFQDRHLFVFVDACYSGAIDLEYSYTPKGSIEDNTSEVLKNIMESTKSTRIMTSSNQKQESYEDEDIENSLFTKALLEAFSNTAVSIDGRTQKADDSEDGILSYIELYNFVQARIKELATTLEVPAQSPETYKEHLRQENDIKFMILNNN